MAWSSEEGLAQVGDCSWPSSGDCEGFCTFPSGEPKDNSSGLFVSLSYLTYGERSKWLEGVNSLFKNLQTLLSKCVSRTNGSAILALAQLNYASHLYKLV